MTQTIRQKFIKIIITLLTLSWGVIAVLSPSLVNSAASNPPSVCGIFGNEQCAEGIDTTGKTGKDAQKSTESFILKVTRVLMFFAAIVCVIYIIIGGYILLTSSGGTDAQKKGRTYIINAIIGLIIILLAQIIVELSIGTLRGAFNIDENNQVTNK